MPVSRNAKPKVPPAAVISMITPPLANAFCIAVRKVLLPGDFVQWGSFAAGTTFDFFLIADGANGGTNVYSTDASINADGFKHAIVHAVVGSPYVLFAFEDLPGGGDQDFGDLVFALQIGRRNVNHLAQTIGAPEPSLALLLSGLFCLIAVVSRGHRFGDRNVTNGPDATS